MAKKKSNPMMDRAKETMGVGVASMAGLGAMGAMRRIPGMPSEAGNVISTTGAGLSIVGTGQMVRNAMTMTDMLSESSGAKKSSVKDKRLKKMLGK